MIPSGNPAEPPCPVCGHPLRRIHRRFIDRLVCVVYPVRRYQCQRVRCGWEGNLRHRKPAARTAP
jgi:hypothetical protein